jgi:hypothetical protein
MKDENMKIDDDHDRDHDDSSRLISARDAERGGEE